MIQNSPISLKIAFFNNPGLRRDEADRACRFQKSGKFAVD